MCEAKPRQQRRDRGNNHEGRQDRGEALKHRGEAEAARVPPRGCLEARLPRGEASASRHTSLHATNLSGSVNVKQLVHSECLLLKIADVNYQEWLCSCRYETCGWQAGRDVNETLHGETETETAYVIK